MKNITIFLIVLLVGCSNTYDVYPSHIAQATHLCAENGGVDSINSVESCSRRCFAAQSHKVKYEVQVTCKDGTEVSKAWKESLD